MIRLRLELRKARDREDGSALILALIFLSILSIGIAALLYMSQTNVATTLAFRTQGANAYGADGAMNAGINSIRTDASQCKEGVTSNLPIPSANGTPVTVTCTGLPGSGATTDDNTSDTPGQALLTLSTSAPAVEDGINQKSNN